MKISMKISRNSRRHPFSRIAPLLAAGLLAGCARPAPQADTLSPTALNVADAAIAGNDPQMALKISQSLLAQNPGDLQALYHEGAAYYALDRCEDAIAAYRLALRIAPKSSMAETGIGRCLLRRNAIEAEQAFATAVADDPGNAAAQNDLGIARALRGDLNGAVPPLQQALMLAPGTASAEVNLGLVLALNGDAADALQYLGPLAATPEATPRIRADYALALVGNGQMDQARQVLSTDLPPGQVQKALAQYQGLTRPVAQAENTPADDTAGAHFAALEPANGLPH